MYNVDGTLNKAGSIKRVCTLDMHIGAHRERIPFRVTDTGSSDVILGLEWLRFHNPLVNWSDGKLFFVQCPPECGVAPDKDLCIESGTPNTPVNLDPPSTAAGPDMDSESIRLFFDYVNTYLLNDEWRELLQLELTPEDEALLCIDIQDMLNHVPKIEHPDTSTHLRQTSEANPANPYLKEFASVFSQTGFDDLPPRRPWDYTIELKPSADMNPVTSKIYSLSRSEQLELDNFLSEHLRTGHIRPSKSPMASPFFFVKKKCGALRPVQDYRRLNDMTIKNRYPLPLISELMDKLKGARFFTKLDVRWGYENIRIKEGDEWKAAFVTNRGLYEPTVMFFGLTNSPATFQNMMNDIFRDLLLTEQLVIYMDDLLIFTDDLATHRIITRQVLTTLQKHHLFLKPEKCFFEVPEIEFLGVIISHGNIRMDPKKIEALQSWPTPQSKKEVQQFLGFVNFY